MCSLCCTKPGNEAEDGEAESSGVLLMVVCYWPAFWNCISQRNSNRGFFSMALFFNHVLFVKELNVLIFQCVHSFTSLCVMQ